MKPFTCTSNQCYIIIKEKRLIIIFTVKHHLVSYGLSFPKYRCLAHTIYSQYNILNHWSHTNTTLHVRKKGVFHATTDGPSAPLSGGWHLHLRQASNVPLWRGSFWFAGRAIGFVFKDQDSERRGIIKQTKNVKYKVCI